jgi:hypothetical protein
MSSDLEHEIQIRIHALPEDQQRHVLTVIEDFLRDQEQPQPPDGRAIWEIFEALSRQVPIDEWSKLPLDGADGHDRYLYGGPKSR